MISQLRSPAPREFRDLEAAFAASAECKAQAAEIAGETVEGLEVSEPARTLLRTAAEIAALEAMAQHEGHPLPAAAAAARRLALFVAQALMRADAAALLKMADAIRSEAKSP